MKKSIKFLLASLSFLIISCRSTDDPVIDAQDPESFFSLNVGNQWVYKTYVNPDFTDTQSVAAFNGKIDSVSIIGKVDVQGLTFFKERTKIVWPNSNLNNKESFKYLRVNTKGHLVYLDNLEGGQITETAGTVLHPGKDNVFTFSYDYLELNQVIGSLFYKLNKEKNIEVNGTQYAVLPYIGVFTPAANQPDLLTKTQEISYKEGLGLVKEIRHFVYSKSYIETRLVSAVIK